MSVISNPIIPTNFLDGYFLISGTIAAATDPAVLAQLSAHQALLDKLVFTGSNIYDLQIIQDNASSAKGVTDLISVTQAIDLDALSAAVALLGSIWDLTATEKANLENSANWTGNLYTGPAITSSGHHHGDGSYAYIQSETGVWRRVNYSDLTSINAAIDFFDLSAGDVTNLTTDSNWSGMVYTGPTITGNGSKYGTVTHLYFKMQDGWYRIQDPDAAIAAVNAATNIWEISGADQALLADNGNWDGNNEYSGAAITSVGIFWGDNTYTYMKVNSTWHRNIKA